MPSKTFPLRRHYVSMLGHSFDMVMEGLEIPPAPWHACVFHLC